MQNHFTKNKTEFSLLENEKFWSLGKASQQIRKASWISERHIQRLFRISTGMFSDLGAKVYTKLCFMFETVSDSSS